jgi:hypothetical protein
MSCGDYLPQLIFLWQHLAFRVHLPIPSQTKVPGRVIHYPEFGIMFSEEIQNGGKMTQLLSRVCV